MLQSTECLGQNDRNLQVRIQLICSCQGGATGSGSAKTSTTPVTRLIDTKSLLQVTPYRGDKASLLGWKWSFLIAVRAISKPLYEDFKKIEENMNQKRRISATFCAPSLASCVYSWCWCALVRPWISLAVVVFVLSVPHSLSTCLRIHVFPRTRSSSGAHSRI